MEKSSSLKKKKKRMKPIQKKKSSHDKKKTRDPDTVQKFVFYLILKPYISCWSLQAEEAKKKNGRLCI